MTTPSPNLAPPNLPEYVRLVLAPNPGPMTGPGTNSILVGAPEGAAGCYIIDPGPEEQSHLETLAREGQARGGVRGIVITHGHADHYEGAQTLSRMTGAPMLAWSREGIAFADEELADEQVIDCGPDRLRVLHTPGHRFDHVCLLLEEARVLFAGDLVAGVGTVVIIPPEGGINEYLRSLRRLLALDLALILPAHGPFIAAPQAKLQEYIDHRLLREQQILEALRAGLDRIPAMVQRIYVDVDPRLHGFAGESVRAHLLKLEEEGRVAQREEGGEILWRLT
ncbi:MAG TPA: MBL fold metallo-hydrolase [Ktedonobacterales bacterium]|nr:MBL fold metallo-hydrolase [Ktedonobacterales bacterium]